MGKSWKTAEIRNLFLGYFKKNGHTVVESSPVVPQNDPTLLFTNAGMVQFKDTFLGNEKRAYPRATTSQKCIRAGGKHNDLENVGFTARHHTFFEMMGNFSFGDYFKKDAIRYAWEFITQELELPRDRLYVTVFEDDDEAAEIWEKQEKVPKNRISRFGEKDNFWSMGDTGPCGPCSEIFYDRGKKYGCGRKDCRVGCECDRYTEFWNLVFMQYNRDATGKMTSLPKPSVDTGAGLERIAAIIQNVESNYEIDLFENIIKKIVKLSGKKYAGDLTASFRVIADHARAITFLISDGVMPSNEGRGYVLRRIMRRAIRHGKKLGFNEPFLYHVCIYVIDEMKGAYPELKDKKEFLEKVVRAEEEQFFRTIENGLEILDEELRKLKGAATGKSLVLSGEIAFKLYDTFGFPLDLTRVICTEQGITVDEKDFEKHMQEQQTRSRKNWKGSGEKAIDQKYLDLVAQGIRPEFVGYDNFTAQAKCLVAITGAGKKGDLVEAIFAKTPFYGESGGQVGDRGLVTGNGFEGKVVDVQKPMPELIVALIKPIKGELKEGQSYLQQTDKHLRGLTAKNHTATHILHWALRKVLGKHVKQAGSLVNPDLLRFDFSHFQAMTAAEVKAVEDLINEKIWSSDTVFKEEMSKDQALEKGAIAFFGEKYGDRVRVVKVGDFSTELCGGTHVDRSSDIHLFKVAGESAIAAGVRRIVAYTSQGAFKYLSERDQEIKQIRDRLKAATTKEVMGKIDKLFQNEKILKKQIEKFSAQSNSGVVDKMIESGEKISDVNLVRNECDYDAKGIKQLRDLSDQIKQKSPETVMVLGMKDNPNKKVFLLTAVGPKVNKKIRANDLLKELAPLIDGRGGGKPDMAQAGGTNPAGLKKAFDQAHKYVSEILK